MRKIFLLWIISIFLPPVGEGAAFSEYMVPATPYLDIYIRERDSLIEFGNSKMIVRLDRESGEWISFLAEGLSDDIISVEDAVPSMDFQIDGVWSINRHGAAVQRAERILDERNSSVTLALVLKVDRDSDPDSATDPEFDFEVVYEYRLYAERGRLDRRMRLRRLPGGDGGDRLENFAFQIPGLLIGDSRKCVVDVPGPFLPNTFIPPGAPYDSLKGRDYRLHSAPDAGFGLVAIGNSSRRTTVSSWMETGGEVAYHTHLISDGQRITLRHIDHRAYRLDRPQEWVSDLHRIEITSTLSEALSLYRDMALRSFPSETEPPAWIQDMVLLEVYPAYYEGGFKGIARRLPAYCEIGFNTLYLMPHWQGGYSPIDLYAVEPSYGTGDDLKELVQAAHGLGMRVLFDMVIHGFSKKSAIPEQHPEMFVRNERGELELHHTWKSITCDWASPAYQKYMADLAAYDAEEYGIDGYRVDAATYKTPNWNADIPYPAYRSGTAAPEVLEEILQALRARNPEAVLLNEVFGPLYYSVCNLVHDNQTEAVPFLLEKMERNEIEADAYKQHLANVFEALPSGSRRVIYARNHDTSWFYRFGGYTPRFMAMEAIHAFFAIPSIFAGDRKHAPHPDDDPATFEYYKKLFAYRKKMPELIRGVAVLREVECDNSWVFTGIRRLENRSVLVAISLSSHEETARIKIPPHYLSNLAKAQPVLWDVIEEREHPVQSGDPQAGSIEIALRPFQVLAGRL